jgi:hypothetical protein
MKQIFEITVLSSFLAISLITNKDVQLNEEKTIQAEIIDTVELHNECKYIRQQMIEEQEAILTEIYYGELELVALLVQAEAGNQDELGKRYVADVVFNRVDSDSFPDTIEEVVYQNNPTQFSVTSNGALEKAGYTITEDVFNIVLEEADKRTNSEIIYFRTNEYHNSGHKAFKHQDHYFSTE